MDRKNSSAAAPEDEHGAAVATVERPKSVAIASQGIRTDKDAAEFLSSLIGDVMTNAVPVRVAQTSVNAMGKLLKVVEMKHKYGNPEDQDRTLQLISDNRSKEGLKKQLLEQLAALN